MNGEQYTADEIRKESMNNSIKQEILTNFAETLVNELKTIGFCLK